MYIKWLILCVCVFKLILFILKGNLNREIYGGVITDLFLKVLFSWLIWQSNGFKTSCTLSKIKILMAFDYFFSASKCPFVLYPCTHRYLQAEKNWARWGVFCLKKKTPRASKHVLMLGTSAWAFINVNCQNKLIFWPTN